MFVLVKSTITGDYHTIYRRDIQDFLRLKHFFNTEDFNFEVIEDVDVIKNILDTEFTSKGRGGASPQAQRCRYKQLRATVVS